MLRIALIEIQESEERNAREDNQPIVSLIKAVNPHIVVLKDNRTAPLHSDAFKISQEAAIFSTHAFEAGSTSIPGVSIFAKFPFKQEQPVHVDAGNGTLVPFFKVGFVRPLGNFDLFITDLPLSTDQFAIGHAGEFLNAGEPLTMIVGRVQNISQSEGNPFEGAGFVQASPSGSHYGIWLSFDMAADFNKADVVSVANHSALVMECNIRMPELQQ